MGRANLYMNPLSGTFYRIIVAGLLFLVGMVCRGTPTEFNIVAYGAKGDGFTLNTVALQRTIDACHAAGGGVVRVPSGDYVTGTIELKSHVTLSLDYGATILGSTDLADYPTEGLDDPREGGPHSVSYTHLTLPTIYSV